MACAAAACMEPSGAYASVGRAANQDFTWDKLSPAEFQQLQDLTACKCLFTILLSDVEMRETSSCLTAKAARIVINTL